LYLYITKNTYSKFTDQHPPVKIVSSANFADYEKAVNGCVALPVSLPSTSGNLPIITVSNHSSFENHLTSKVSELPKNHYLLVVPIDSHFLYGLMNGICLPRHDDTYMLTIGLNYHYTPYSAMTTCGFLGFIQTTDKTLEFFPTLDKYLNLPSLTNEKTKTSTKPIVFLELSDGSYLSRVLSNINDIPSDPVDNDQIVVLPPSVPTPTQEDIIASETVMDYPDSHSTVSDVSVMKPLVIDTKTSININEVIDDSTTHKRIYNAIDDFIRLVNNYYTAGPLLQQLLLPLLHTDYVTTNLINISQTHDLDQTFIDYPNSIEKLLSDINPTL